VIGHISFEGLDVFLQNALRAIAGTKGICFCLIYHSQDRMTAQSILGKKQKVNTTPNKKKAVYLNNNIYTLIIFFSFILFYLLIY